MQLITSSSRWQQLLHGVCNCFPSGLLHTGGANKVTVLLTHRDSHVLVFTGFEAPQGSGCPQAYYILRRLQNLRIILSSSNIQLDLSRVQLGRLSQNKQGSPEHGQTEWQQHEKPQDKHRYSEPRPTGDVPGSENASEQGEMGPHYSTCWPRGPPILHQESAAPLQLGFAKRVNQTI